MAWCDRRVSGLRVARVGYVPRVENGSAAGISPIASGVRSGS